MKLIIIHGPNLNLLGKREPSVYGEGTFEYFYQGLCKDYPEVEFSFFQSNHEGALIDKLHQVGFSYDISGSVKKAYGIGRNGSFFGDIFQVIGLKTGKKENIEI